MLSRLLRVLLVIIVGGGVLWIGQQTYPKFAHDIEMKNPFDVFSNATNTANSTNTTNPEGGDINIDDPNINTPDIELPTIKVNDITLKKPNLSFNFSGNGALLSFRKGATKQEVDDLIMRIRISERETKLPYDKVKFEKAHNYSFEGKSLNRLDYAWNISKRLIRNTDSEFAYRDPYTNLVIKDKNNLTYDYIINLENVWYHGGYGWSSDKIDAFINDIETGVAMSKGFNSSKLDNEPNEWLPIANPEDYCWTYLNLCAKYDISMTKRDFNICKLQLYNALDTKEPIELITKNILNEEKPNGSN